MSFDQTQHQSPEEQADAQAKSRAGQRPPAEIEGYSMIRPLGSGAFGEVWLAIDETTRRRVAIKFYNRRSVSDVRGLAKEVEKLVTLSADRYVVQLFDVGWDADPPFYVMDFVERGSLEDLLRSERKLPVTEALEIFQETAFGLMHLHGKGVLHCDLKPGNVLLDEDSKPRLADFGQSRLSNDATPSLGTLFYMAPEQADLDAVPDAKWDVYALGALLFVMLTGRPPYFDQSFSGQLESTGDIRHRLEAYRNGIMSAEMPSKHRQVIGVDRALSDIMERCIARNPKDRYASVQSVLLALRQRHDAINRRPLLVLGIVGPLLLLLVLLVFGWNVYRQAILDSDAALTSKAVESNRFAAKFAARSAAEQIDNYFREIQELTRNAELQQRLHLFLEDDAVKKLRTQLADPNRNNDETLLWVRSEFLTTPTREDLQNLLRSYHESKKLEHVASWWIYDLQGNQLAGVFQAENKGDEQKINTVGRNYSYRSYFSGLPDDLITTLPDGKKRYNVSEDPMERRHIMRSHISSVFLSEQSRTWKIAFSTPIFWEDQIIGIAGLTVQMGDFIDFDAGQNQYALMFDQRDGENFGVILEHPLFVQLALQNQQLPIESNAIRVDPQALLEVPCHDPLGTSTDDARFKESKIAAVENIEFSDDSQNQRRDTGLAVAVLEDYANVIKPSHVLGTRLFRMGIWAALVLLLVAMAMWILVSRMFKESRRRLSRAFAGAMDLDSTFDPASARPSQSSEVGVTEDLRTTRRTQS